MLRRYFRSFPLLLGLSAGVLLSGAAVGALVVAGVIGTAGLNTRLAPQLYIWDTHGRSDRTLWETIPQRSRHRFASAQDIYVETGFARIVYAGSASSPTTFSPKPLESSHSRPFEQPGGDESFPTGPVLLKSQNNQEAQLIFSPEGKEERVELIGTLHGVAWESAARVDRRRIDLMTFEGPWTLKSYSKVEAKGADTSRVRTFPVPATYARAWIVNGAPGLVVVGTKNMRLVLDGRGPGKSHLYLQPLTRRFRVYVGLMPWRVTSISRRFFNGNVIRQLYNEAATAFSRFHRP